MHSVEVARHGSELDVGVMLGESDVIGRQLACVE